MQRQGNCHLCGKFGHFQHECPNNPNKGKGKGKGKSGYIPPKGKGKGKGGPIECWTCGGDHRRVDCPHNPWNQSSSKGFGKKGIQKGHGTTFGKGGKGHINSLHYEGPYDGGYDYGQPTIDFFGSLKTVEPEDKIKAKYQIKFQDKQITKISNKYQELTPQDDGNEEESETEKNMISASDTWSDDIKDSIDKMSMRRRKKMMRVKRWRY